MLRKFEMPWRPVYEAYAAAAWAIAILFLAGVAIVTPMPSGPVWYMAAVGFAFLTLNLNKAWNIWSLKYSLSGYGVEYTSFEEVRKKTSQEQDTVWLGYGFNWQPVHTQRIYELKKLDAAHYLPPDAFLKIREKLIGKNVGSLSRENPGAPWIHGIEPNEDDIHMPLGNLIGNSLIVGTTRCGKTRMLDVLLTQFIQHPNSCVICIDPKGDQELRDNMKRSSDMAGRSFYDFHLAFPSSSIRIDPLKNYNNPSELASRLSSLMASEDNDAFQAFAWNVTNAIVLGLIDAGIKPTILRIRQYVEGGVATLLAKVLIAYFSKKKFLVPDFDKREIEFIRRNMKRDKDGELPARDANPREILAAHMMMYDLLFKPMDGKEPDVRSEAVEALTNIHNHDAAHSSKMLANFLPILGMLTSGALASLLSSDGNDIDDSRLATDMMSLINSKSVVYIGLNALADKTTAGAVGAMLLSDLAACAAARYNFNVGSKSQRIYLVVDEAHQVVNDPYISILNMGGGSGFANVAATQTISDFNSRLGSEDKARVMLGNFNNLFALRSKDRLTQDFITETFGKSYVQSMQTSQGTNSSTEQNVTHFAGTVGERLSETLEEMIPTEILGKLPNWQFIASVSGGRIIKGRVPIINS